VNCGVEYSGSAATCPPSPPPLASTDGNIAENVNEIRVRLWTGLPSSRLVEPAVRGRSAGESSGLAGGGPDVLAGQDVRRQCPNRASGSLVL
jgi:hypothetical protein